MSVINADGFRRGLGRPCGEVPQVVVAGYITGDSFNPSQRAVGKEVRVSLWLAQGANFGERVEGDDGYFLSARIIKVSSPTTVRAVAALPAASAGLGKHWLLELRLDRRYRNPWVLDLLILKRIFDSKGPRWEQVVERLGAGREALRQTIARSESRAQKKAAAQRDTEAALHSSRTGPTVVRSPGDRASVSQVAGASFREGAAVGVDAEVSLPALVKNGYVADNAQRDLERERLLSGDSVFYTGKPPISGQYVNVRLWFRTEINLKGREHRGCHLHGRVTEVLGIDRVLVVGGIEPKDDRPEELSGCWRVELRLRPALKYPWAVYSMARASRAEVKRVQAFNASLRAGGEVRPPTNGDRVPT